MYIINVLALILVSFFIGYFLGKGKIEIVKKMSKKEEKELKEMYEKQLKEFEEYNEQIKKLNEFDY